MLKTTLSASEKETLLEGFLNQPKACFRKKCHIVVLHAECWTPKSWGQLYKFRNCSIYEWLHAYEKDGFLSLYLDKGRGVKSAMGKLSRKYALFFII